MGLDLAAGSDRVNKVELNFRLSFVRTFSLDSVWNNHNEVPKLTFIQNAMLYSATFCVQTANEPAIQAPMFSGTLISRPCCATLKPEAFTNKIHVKNKKRIRKEFGTVFGTVWYGTVFWYCIRPYAEHQGLRTFQGS